MLTVSPLNDCALVLEDGGDEDEAIAALLHDAAEDASGQATLFGERVARIVGECWGFGPAGFTARGHTSSARVLADTACSSSRSNRYPTDASSSCLPFSGCPAIAAWPSG